MQSTSDTRVRILVSGIVQGVGFRPYVHNLASKHALGGFVRNNSGVVEIEVQGDSKTIDSFMRQLTEQTPPLASIKQLSTESVMLRSDAHEMFRIIQSEQSPTDGPGFVPPDTATCLHCLTELFDPGDRRFRYPFINCTNCGPRFTIMSGLPYDRATTTMSVFKMCGACQAEFDEPSNRRFHAQPNACATCGPTLQFLDSRTNRGLVDNAGALGLAERQLAQGKIIALKGLGGFQLVCDASNQTAISELRSRKRRKAKPFALMMADLEMVKKYCSYSNEEAEELGGSIRPIVLLERLPTCQLPPEIATGINKLGVMLPYTPLHHLLLSDFGKPLIVTSGNVSEEPIAKENEEALARLKKIADGFLLHDRKIRARYDDSVVQFASKERVVIRRARGIAPVPINLPFRSTLSVLGCGAHLKNTFCLIQDDQAFVSQHIGDLENMESQGHFQETFDIYTKLFGVEPELIAHDCHPDYLSTQYAEHLSGQGNLPRFAVQHHHAHIVSCMVENGLIDPTIGIAFDGLGYGLDGTLWGGEFFLATLKDFRRLAHFKPIPLPGGSAGVRRPWSMALSYILYGGANGNETLTRFIDLLCDRYGRKAVSLISNQIETKLNAPLISSCGRLFDAMSALLGVCFEADYEGQAAMQLEAMANSAPIPMADRQCSYPYEIAGAEAPFFIDCRKILQAGYADFVSGVSPSEVAMKFHISLAELVLSVCERIRALTKCSNVCLGGGVFQNTLLLRLVERSLLDSGFKVFFPRKLPANDGGLSMGQAVIALAQASAITEVS